MSSAVIEMNHNRSKGYRAPTGDEKEKIVSAWNEYFENIVKKEKKIFGTCAFYGIISIAFFVMAALCLATSIVGAVTFGAFGLMCLIGPIPMVREFKRINAALSDLNAGNFMIMETMATDFHMEQKEGVDGNVVDEAYVDAVSGNNRVVAKDVLIPFDWAEKFVKSGIVYQFPIILIKIDGYDRLLAIAI